MAIEYPVKVRVSANFLAEFYQCEFGRFEDAKGARESGDTESIEANDYQTVFCDFGDRFKTVIEMRNAAELCEAYYAAASGTIGLYMPRAANTFLDKIRDKLQAVNPDLVKRWPFQDGY